LIRTDDEQFEMSKGLRENGKERERERVKTIDATGEADVTRSNHSLMMMKMLKMMPNRSFFELNSVDWKASDSGCGRLSDA
jgi:hypothetical protein